MRTAIVTDTSSALMAAPPSASFTGVAPPLPLAAIAYTATDASAAPAKANQTYPVSVWIPAKAMARTTPTEAPWLMPRMPGSAIGLRVMPWRTVPARASAAPTIRADEGARDAQLADDLGVVAVPAVQQGVEYGRRRDRPRAHREAEQDREQQGRDGGGRPADAADRERASG